MTVARAYAPFLPTEVGGIPAKNVDRHCIEEFVREANSLKRRGYFGKVFRPLHLLSKRIENFMLMISPPWRGLDDQVSSTREEFRLELFQIFQNIRGQESVMCTPF